jgi:hypothetical protein
MIAHTILNLYESSDPEPMFTHRVTRNAFYGSKLRKPQTNFILSPYIFVNLD